MNIESTRSELEQINHLCMSDFAVIDGMLNLLALSTPHDPALKAGLHMVQTKFIDLWNSVDHLSSPLH